MIKLLNFKKQIIIFPITIGLFFSACGGGNSSSNQNSISQKIIGYLIDSPVVNMDYSCGKIQGKTASDGKFECDTLPITFSIGNFEIGSLTHMTKDGKVYPQDLVGVSRDNISNPEVLKIASFLQSLDEDGDISLSITIPDDIQLNTDSQKISEMTQEEINTLLKENGIKPITIKMAAQHLRATLALPTPTPIATPTPTPTATPTPTQIPIAISPRPTPTPDLYPYIPKNLNSSTAIRFLNKATFGATQKDIKHLQKIGIEAWIDKQLAMPLQDNIYLTKMIKLAKEAEPTINPYSVDEYLADNDKVFNKERASFHSPRYRMSAWFDIALTSNDQLRHKLAYALSQIIVESDFEPIFTRRADALGRYFDILQKNAFGSYQNLLNDISFSSGMGLFLTYNGNKKKYINEANITVYPDENYAREIMQLFSIGLNELNMDGTPKKDSGGNLIPTYTQEDVNELARVFTGWDNKRSGAGDNNIWDKYGRVGFTRGDFTHPMEFTPEYHDFEEKKLLGGTIPAGLSGEDDIKKAITVIMKNQNVAPYISKNLIMRFTKSNPSPNYVKRVATVFNSTKGDLKAVIKTILLDREIWEDINSKEVVKFKEPLIAYTNFLRAFNAKAFPKWYFCGYGSPSDDTASNCELVTNQFLFNNTRDFLNQGAGLAPTVFNFYDNSFIPNSDDFKSSKSVAPENQIQSDTVFIKFSNKISKDLEGWEKNYLTNAYMPDYKNGGANGLKRYDTVEAFASDAPARGYIPVYYVGANKVLLDATEELNVMEEVIDGDTNGNFEKLQDYREQAYHDDEKAIEALINHLNKKLTGGLLTTEQIDSIYNNLKDAKLYNIYDVHDEDNPKYDKKASILRNAIFPAIRAIVTSNTFMTE